MQYEAPHRRFNWLTNSWVLVSPQRTKRPWLGQVEKTSAENLPAYDPSCYLMPWEQPSCWAQKSGIHWGFCV